MRRGVVVGVAALTAVLVGAELAALPVASRMIGDALGRCLPYEGVEIDTVDRPVVPRLLIGRASGVEMSATGLVLGGLRVHEANLEVPVAILPWAPGSPQPRPALLELLLVEDDLEAFLSDGVPFGLRPSVELTPGVAELGMEPFPVRVEVAVSVEDRVVHIAPAGEEPEWWNRVPIPDRFLLPDELRLEALRVGQGSVATTLVVDELPGIDGTRECTGPLA